MAVRPVRTLPDPVLQRRAKRVSSIDGSIQRLIDDLLETMPYAGGVGLAAPQIGVSLRVITLQMPDEEPMVMINPEVVKRSGEREVSEGCLSVPGYVGEIKRSESVTVKGQDRHGKSIRFKATGLMAQALEHELDHLNGVLYLDHLERREDLHHIEPPAPEEEGD